MLPYPEVRNRRWMPRMVWIVPIVAIVVGLSLLIRSWDAEGPRITISFLNGEGIQLGKTLVKFRDVTVGRVSGVKLSPDHQSVLVTADLTNDAVNLVKQDTQFWIVRPSIGVGGVSGLDTLLSGSYIGMQSGASTTTQHEFVGLEKQPPLSHGPNGVELDLHTSAAQSLATGAPVYFRHFQVGRIIDENLRTDKSMRVSIFIDAPYDQFIKHETRFWNASGVDLSLGADGLEVRTESLAAVLAGGIAFDDGPPNGALSSAGDATRLYQSEKEAMAPPDGQPRYFRMRFAHSVRGLAVGAPVEFVGVNIGTVVAVDLGYEAKDRSFPLIVTAKLFPRRMGQAYASLEAQGTTESEETMATFVGTLVGRGLRSQLRSESLISAKLYVALDFLSGAAPVSYDPTLRPLELPTVDGTTQELENNIDLLVKKVNRLPLQQIAADLDIDLADLQGTLGNLNGRLIPGAVEDLGTLHETLHSLNGTLEDGSPLKRSIDDTLAETQSTLQSVRDLADYLDRHPDALLRGRRAAKIPEPKPSDGLEGMQ